MSARERPNLLITGTPGVGKSTLCDLVVSVSGLKHVDSGKLVREKGLHTGYDAEFDTLTLDEDRLCDELEPVMSEGGVVLEAHSCDYFPERWFDLVVVLRASNTQLYDRLSARQYSKRKIDENLECEIMQVLSDEARENYQSDIVWELVNDTVEQLEGSSRLILQWINGFPTSRGTMKPPPPS